MPRSHFLGAVVTTIKTLYPPDFEFPLASTLAIPTDYESDLYTDPGWTDVDLYDVDAVQPLMDIPTAYALATFGVRAAIDAVRTASPARLNIAATTLVIDRGKMDWRDVIVALSIMEDCADRIEVNLESLFAPPLRLADTARRHTISTGWFSRPKEERSSHVGGFIASIGRDGLQYMRKL